MPIDKMLFGRYEEYMDTKLLEQLKHYENKWVALLDKTQEIVGAGEDASQARREAEDKGIKDAILFRVMPFTGRYVPHA